MEQVDGAEIRQDKRHHEGEKTENQETSLVFLHTLHVHLQSGQEHDVVQSHTPEKLKRRVAFQNVEAILPHKHTRQHHADDVRNAQLAHDDGGKQNDAEHDKENQCRVCDGEIMRNVQHSECKVNKK